MKKAYLFSGQGAQSVGMGKTLYESSPAARAVFEQADQNLGWKISQVCFEGPEDKLLSTICCQPAIFTVSMAALASYREKNGADTELAGCAGLSLGEYAALAAADAISFGDALKVLARRAEFMDEACRAAEGTMAAVIGGTPEMIAETAEKCGIDVANYNCPGQTVISGFTEGVLKACTLLKEQGVKRALPLKVAGAFHSRMMAEAGEKLRAVLDKTEIRTPSVPVMQNYTGKAESDPAVIRENLVRQVAGSVRMESCIRELTGAGAEKLIEFGPGTVLTGLARRISSDCVLENVN